MLDLGANENVWLEWMRGLEDLGLTARTPLLLTGLKVALDSFSCSLACLITTLALITGSCGEEVSPISDSQNRTVLLAPNEAFSLDFLAGP